MAQERKCAHRCLRGDGDTQRLGRSRKALSAMLSLGRHGAEGRHPRREGSTHAGPGVGDASTRLRPRARRAVASREACDEAECTGPD